VNVNSKCSAGHYQFTPPEFDLPEKNVNDKKANAEAVATLVIS